MACIWWMHEECALTIGKMGVRLEPQSLTLQAREGPHTLEHAHSACKHTSTHHSACSLQEGEIPMCTQCLRPCSGNIPGGRPRNSAACSTNPTAPPPLQWPSSYPLPLPHAQPCIHLHMFAPAPCAPQRNPCGAPLSLLLLRATPTNTLQEQGEQLCPFNPTSIRLLSKCVADQGNCGTGKCVFTRAAGSGIPGGPMHTYKRECPWLTLTHSTAAAMVEGHRDSERKPSETRPLRGSQARHIL